MAAPLLPLVPPAVVLALLLSAAVLFWRRRPSLAREQRLAGVTAVLTALVLAGGALFALRAEGLERAAMIAGLARQFDDLLGELEHEAQRVAAEIAPQDEGASERRWAFERLHRLGATVSGDTTLLLVNPDGEAVAWAGPGLRHELPGEELPRDGVGQLTSFTAATLYAVAAHGGERRAWRVVAGRSYSTAELPFALPAGAPPGPHRWSLQTGELGSYSSGAAVVLPGRGELVVVVEGLDSHAGAAHAAELGARLAFLLLGIGLGALGALRAADPLLGTGDPLLGTGERPHPVPLYQQAAWLAFGLGLLAHGLGASWQSSLLLLAGLLLAGFALARPLAAARGAWLAPLLGAGAVLALFGLALLYQRLAGAWDLGRLLFVGTDGTLVRLGLWGLALASALGLRRPRPCEGSDSWAWLALLLLACAAAALESPAAAVPLLALAGGLLARWAFDRRSLGRFLGLGLLCAVLAAGVWEVSQRLALRHYLRSEALPALAPPEKAARHAVTAELERFLETLDLAAFALGDPDRITERQDLALGLWLASPLSRLPVLSSLVVVPGDGEPATFSYGLAAPWDRAADAPEAALAPWSGGLLSGMVPLHSRGLVWGEARYWLELRPRGASESTEETEERQLEAELLRGEPRAGTFHATLPGGAFAAAYRLDGTPVGAAEEGDTLPLQLELLARGSGRVTLGEGSAWAWAAEFPASEAEPNEPAADGVVVAIYLPRLGLQDALGRVGIHAAGTVVVLMAVVAVALALGLPGPAFRKRLQRDLRSYSRRLIVVFTLLLLVPLTLLNLVLFRTLEERSTHEQRSGGEAALTATQRILVDYLTQLDPGFTIDNAIDDELLLWLSQVVRHEVNLYWRGYVYASSRPDLFTAGLLPRRIPGEVFARLSLLGRSLAVRENRVGSRTRYLEVYGPLLLPGETAGQGRLFLSVPLLAQQEEANRELNELRRLGLVVTMGLFFLLAAVGARLARSFAQPLTQIVAGTDRIAAGESSLGLAPAEPELAALVEAIDDMAVRIAEARRRLLQEKRLLEGVVDNITAGVVSFDRQLRVLMRNRVAAELLGVEVGDDLDTLVASPTLRAASTFLARHSPDGPRRTTVRVRRSPSGAEEEWTLVWAPVPGEGDPAALLVVEDASEVLRAQRLEAWAEMARLIAHEIKNPLTPIRLSTEHMRQVYAQAPERFDEVFERCTSHILEQVQELYETASDFSTYSQIPRAEPKPGDLVAVVRDVASPYCDAPPPGVEVSFGSDRERLAAFVDPKLLGRAVRNLIENAVRASGSTGEIRIEVHGNGGFGSISVEDRGPGVPARLLDRIFDPYFSTSSGGTGLGLPIARRVAEEHGGSVVAENREGGGLRVVITIPLS